MPKVLAGCHHNEGEISRHFKNYRILTSPNEWQQICNRLILREPVEVVKGSLALLRYTGAPHTHGMVNAMN